MEVDRDCLKEEKARLLRRLAEIEVEQQQQLRRGKFKSVPLSRYPTTAYWSRWLGQS